MVTPSKQPSQQSPFAAPAAERRWQAIPTTESLRLATGFSNEAERRRVLEWLCEGLRPGRPGRLESEYPALFARNASAFHFTLFDRDQPVAFTSLFAVTFRVGVHRMRTAMISNVYTDPAHRGRGLAKRLLRHAIHRAEALEIGLIALWSDLTRLYRPLGFDRSGREALLVADHEVVERALAEGARNEPPEIRPAVAADWPEIERLRGYRICQLELDPGEIARAKGIPDMFVRVAIDRDGVQAFAMRGRGDDFEEVIHEWGGDTRAALLCCRALVAECEPASELFMIGPACGDDLAWALRRAGARFTQQPLAWMRIGSTRAFAMDLARLLPTADGLELECLSDPDEAPRIMRVRSPLGESVIQQSLLLEGIFGSATRRDPTPVKKRLAKALGPANLDELPIPFFVWGLESI